MGDDRERKYRKKPKRTAPMTLETGKPVAEARRKQTPRPTSSSPTLTLLYHQRQWIDVEPGKFDKTWIEVSKQVIRLLRHDPTVLR